MATFSIRRGQRVQIEACEYELLRRMPGNRWQLQNVVTGEWCTFLEQDLLDQFATGALSFTRKTDDNHPFADKLRDSLNRDISAYPPDLVASAQIRVEYLKEVDRQQPIPVSRRTIESLIRLVAHRNNSTRVPSCRTVCRDYRKWLATGRDIRAIIPRHADRGNRLPRVPAEVRAVCDQVIDELYMTLERKRVPEVHLEILRRLNDENRFRAAGDKLPIPSQRMIYREIARKAPTEVMAARYGKRRVEMEFRVSGEGPKTSRALERVLMDHTPADMIVVDDNSMLPLGRPTITTAIDEYTRCPIGFYSGFEPPSCLAVMQCLRHAILPKTYISREFPSIRNPWECYGVPELVVVDNPPEFHSTHFERACAQIGIDIQFAKVLVPWYKGKIERFQGTMNRDLLHGAPGTTFSNILERDDYDPGKHAVVLLSTFREIVHKWIVDVYLQTPHRGIQDLPANRWRRDINGLPPPLPPSASSLDTLLGMTTQRVVFHYGIELEGLRYNSGELGELRRRMGTNPKLELTFDPGDLGHINVLEPYNGSYIRVPALDSSYAARLSLWQHRVIRRYTQQQLAGRTDVIALSQAKAEIRALVDHDFHRKSTRGRKRHARFLFDSTPACTTPTSPDNLQESGKWSTAANIVDIAGDDFFSDDDVLPVFEANLDLPRASGAIAISEADVTRSKEVRTP